MKNLVNIEDAVASSLEDFHPVVKPFNKATGKPFEKIIGMMSSRVSTVPSIKAILIDALR